MTTTNHYRRQEYAEHPKGLIPFKVDFGQNPSPIKDADRQARLILDEVRRLYNAGTKIIGLTYSANQEQTDTILSTYNNGGWQTNTFGANQAMVIQRIELHLLMYYRDLQTVYRTVPITTMKYEDKTGSAAAADDASVQKSLENAEQLLSSGAIILGWQNQDSSPKNLAIGGGVAIHVQPESQKQLIQTWVNKHLQQSPMATTASIQATEDKITPVTTMKYDDKT